MLGLKLNHISERGSWLFYIVTDKFNMLHESYSKDPHVTLIRHISDTDGSDRCPVNIDAKVFVIISDEANSLPNI